MRLLVTGGADRGARTGDPRCLEPATCSQDCRSAAKSGMTPTRMG